MISSHPSGKLDVARLGAVLHDGALGPPLLLDGAALVAPRARLAGGRAGERAHEAVPRVRALDAAPAIKRRSTRVIKGQSVGNQEAIKRQSRVPRVAAPDAAPGRVRLQMEAVERHLGGHAKVGGRLERAAIEPDAQAQRQQKRGEQP